MGSELLTEDSLPPKTLTEIFWQAYPAYLAMGMTSDEYWNGDAQACVAYRRAYKEKLEMQDAMLWRQGLYVYHALCSVAPLFSLKPRKPESYLDKPFGFMTKEEAESRPNPKAIEYMKNWANKVNAIRKQNNGK